MSTATSSSTNSSSVAAFDGAAPADTLHRYLELVSGSRLLEGQSVILTGASGGIGKVTAQVLAGAGARLTLMDLAGGLDEVGSLVAELGADFLLAPADASDFQAFRQVVDDALSQFGVIDGLVNCAGLWAPQPYDEVTPESWELNLRSCLQTAFAGCQAVLPHLIARGRGSIVNFASTAGEYGSVRPAAHYAAAKAGVIGLTKSLAREASPHGVRVNAISPGPIGTEALGAQTPEAIAQIGARTLLGRVGRPEEISGACVFLLSELSTFVTGHVLRVNGGALL